MMDFKKSIPHLIAVAVLFAVTAAFYLPNLSGKALTQGDNLKARGMQAEIQSYLDKGQESPLWTNSAFAGMPAYQISMPVGGNLVHPIFRAVSLWQPISSVWSQTFLAMLCMYLFLSVLKLDWRAAVFGALAFGLSTYNVDILEAGHSTKMRALALAPGMMAGAVLIGQGRWWIGGGLSALFGAMQVLANHVQISYYTLLLLGIYFLAIGVEFVRKGLALEWIKRSAVWGFTVALAFLSNTGRLWPTWEYGKETIRGRSELTQSNVNRGDGLTTDYAFGWSYGVGESMTLIVPHAYGGGANESITGTQLFESVSRGASPAEKREVAQQTSGLYYKGDQAFVGTAIYFGAVVCMLFILGAFLAQGPLKWWLFLGGLFAISLAWGKNFFLNFILFDYLPMFNKFRAVSMALGMGQLMFAALAAMGLQKYFDSDISADRKQKALYFATGASVALCLVAMAVSGGEGPFDKERLGAQYQSIIGMLIDDRAALARADAFRSIGFILGSAAVLWLAARGTLKATVSVLLVAAISLVDTWSVCRRTLQPDNFRAAKTAMAPPKAEAFDQQIKQDKDLHYRVLDLMRGGLTGNAYTSYYHKSLSGYHAAKLQRYQEVIDTFFTQNIGRNLHVAGMFNAKYLIGQKGEVIPNPEALGNAWFVKHFYTVPTADAEFGALHRLHPRDTAVVQAEYAGPLQGLNIIPDSTASIRLTAYHPDKMEYEYSAKTEQLALFSEVYYPPAKGWKCYLNGAPAPDFIKADYLLRAMRLPAGQNMKLEMRFEPRSYYTGRKISMAASALTLLLFAAGMFFWYKKGGSGGTADLTDFAAAENTKPEPKVAAKKPKRN